MTSTLVLTPVATVRNDRQVPLDDGWDGVTSVVELNADVVDQVSLTGLDDFSHVEILFHFHQVPETGMTFGARRPRGRTDWPEVGIFAQRGKDRPNRLGSTMCALLGVDGHRLVVRGLDAIDGTPVLDIKPVIRDFLPRGALRQPDWADAIMQAYW